MSSPQPKDPFMLNKLLETANEFIRDESGQSITEYGAVIAFVGTIIAIAFSISKGTFFGSISQSYSSTTSQLQSLNYYASQSGS